MKISLTLHGNTHSVESADQFDGQDVYELVNQFRGLMVSAGFHPESVDRLFNIEEQWFTQNESDDSQMTLNWPGDFHNKHDQYEIYNQTT